MANTTVARGESPVQPSLEELLDTPMSVPIPENQLTPHLSCPPWYEVDGAVNFRCVLHWPQVRRNLIYRSGTLSELSTSGKEKMTDTLGIKTIFDFRHKQERDSDPEPDIEGVRTVTSEVEQVNQKAWKSVRISITVAVPEATGTRGS